jgi:fucose permease
MSQREGPSGRAALSANTLVGFLVLGWSGGALGPALPWLAGHWAVRLEESGALFTMLFLGACVTVPGSGVLLDRIGRKPVLLAGLSLLALGLGGIILAPGLGVALGGALCLGFGWGCLDVTLNVFVADLYPTARNTALNLMNGAFGVGALVGPVTVGAALEAGVAPLWVLLALAGVALGTAAVYGLLRFPARLAPVVPDGGPAPAPVRVWREGYVLLVVVLLFLYVGLETGFGGWAYSFAQQGAALSAGAAASVVAVYWTSFTLGRLAAGLVARWVPGAGLILVGAGLAVAGAGLIAVFSTQAAALFVGAALVGLGSAPIFPTAFGLAGARYPATVGLVSSLAVLGGTLGGAVIPYAIGQLLAATGVPGAAGFIAATGVLILLFQLALIWGFRPRPAPAAAPGYAAYPAERG